ETTRVDRPFAEPKLVMKVRACRAPGRTYECDSLTAGKCVAGCNVDPREMAVARFQAIAVVDLDHLAVAALPSSLGHHSGCGGLHNLAPLAVDIHSAVKFV